MYLLNKGFITGNPVPVDEVAAEFSISKDDAMAVISKIETHISTA
jgi:hypothetical protein